ncbi:MAG: KEOPS complex kinase/ATPase Bud32 [Candidatus Micrarchaeota archaeon]
MHGAEAIVTPCTFFNASCVAKRRLPKVYRNLVLDSKLRRERTKLEARLLHRAKERGVSCPLVLNVDLEKCEIVESQLNGVKLVDFLKTKNVSAVLQKAGVQLALLHSAGISHGDATTSNFMVCNDGDKVFLFDFGLSQGSASLEDQAIDILLFEKSVSPQQFVKFLTGYRGERGEKQTTALLRQVAEIKSRCRYVER